MLIWNISLTNSKGPKDTALWAPNNTGSKFEGWLLMTTNRDQSNKYGLNQYQSQPEIPMDHSLARSWLWDIYRIKGLVDVKINDVGLVSTGKDLIDKNE